MGGDLKTFKALKVFAGFNPRPRMGGDADVPRKSDTQAVSIHAPAWGATLLIPKASRLEGFQSTPPHGGRPSNIERAIRISMFQSTPPHGGRRKPPGRCGPVWRFNPRPRMGGDHISLSSSTLSIVSIHAPAWGATTYVARTIHMNSRFNPRPRMGGDVRPRRIQRKSEFQSTPPHGGRLY
mgnify:CR=1 FL=1